MLLVLPKSPWTAKVIVRQSSMTLRKEMTSQSKDFAQKTIDLAVKIVSATSKQDGLSYMRELTQEGRKISTMCDEFERTWGAFFCKTKNDDETDGPVNNSADVK